MPKVAASTLDQVILLLFGSALLFPVAVALPRMRAYPVWSDNEGDRRSALIDAKGDMRLTGSSGFSD